jgi:hypothetical protein
MQMVQVKTYGRRKKDDTYNEPNKFTAEMLVRAGLARYAEEGEVPVKAMTPQTPKRRRGRKKKGYNRADMAGQLETK